MCSRCRCCRCRNRRRDARSDIENMRTRRVLVNDLDARNVTNCCCGCGCADTADNGYNGYESYNCDYGSTATAESTGCDCGYSAASSDYEADSAEYARRFNNCETCR